MKRFEVVIRVDVEESGTSSSQSDERHMRQVLEDVFKYNGSEIVAIRGIQLVREIQLR